MLTDDEMWDDPQQIPKDNEPYWDDNGLHEDNYGRITRRPKLTEYERLEALADMGIDTWDDYEGNK
jgi:hypothetical protein